MGCRLHHATKYKVEWEGGYFNWQAEDLLRLFDDIGVEYWQTNAEDDYSDLEIPKHSLQKLQKSLKEKTVSWGEDYNISPDYLSAWVKKVLDESEPLIDYVRFAWF